MSQFLQCQMDYAHFVCGWVFILIGLIARATARMDARRLPWRWLGYFGGVRGIYEWLEMILISLPALAVTPCVRVALLTVSYSCLVEFARRSAPQPIGGWVHAVLLAAIGFSWVHYGAQGALLCIHGAAGVVAAAWAAYACLRAAATMPTRGERAYVTLFAVALIIQGLVSAWMAVRTGIVCSGNEPPDTMTPAVKLMRAGVIIGMVMGVWGYFRLQRRQGLSASVVSAGKLYEKLITVGLAAVFVGGGLAANIVGHRTSEGMKEEILNRTKIAGATVDTNLVKQLTWSDADLGQPYYEILKAMMMAIRGANEDLVFASLMGIRDGKSYVLVDSEPPDSEDYSPPGQYYEEADPEYNRLLEARVPFVVGPLYDRWGVWMTGAVPITDAGPPPGAVALALDLNASHWNITIARARLPVLLIAMFIGGLVLSFSVAQQRARETAVMRKAAADRFARQKEAIVRLATSPRLAEADFKTIAREITEVGAEALQVERVGIWMGGQHERKLTCVDLFERSTGRHSDGTVLTAEPYPRYFDALSAGRAIDAHDARNDPRTSEFRDSYLIPLGITSMLDAPIRVSGRVMGVVCYEHVGAARVWTEDEIRFAAETADQAAQALAYIERRRTEDAKRKLEQQIQYSQKLESLGVLAGGIAHDFNNMLMVILGNVDLALSALPPNSPVQENLKEVESISQRAADLCRQLLAYAGKGRFVVQPIDLNRMILDMRNMLEISVSKKASLRFELADDLPPIEADATQMQQILMNLVINASEALEEREGSIVVTTSHRWFETQELTPPWSPEPLVAGEYVVLQVSDTGCGIPPEVRERIFEPFFTTKFSGRGLGLAAVMGIVQGHKGTIRVYSERGRGSVFRVLLPASKRGAALQELKTEKPDEWRTTGTVLVVDDEAAVCRVTANMLAPLGLKVLTASDGRQALEILRARRNEIDCVLLDLTMPRMDGGEAFHEIRKLCPEIPIILSSGYTEQVIAERFAGAEFIAFLEKPYSRARLVEILKKVLRTA